MNDELDVTIKEFLPLSINKITWHGTILNIVGEDWSFFTISTWRILCNNIMIAGSLDNGIEKKIELLKTKKLLILQ